MFVNPSDGRARLVQGQVDDELLDLKRVLTYPMAIASSISCCAWASFTVPTFQLKVSMVINKESLLETTI